ncbi:MAG: hypothetical protein Ct9H300mP13_4250 [Gammaproteobacteria bacterium]|nr:MAG: hypothetical protein Ct9H300mP13_4250 [Gammaproteobacteria bacterium]
MIYNIPQCSNIDITPDFFKRLLEIDNINTSRTALETLFGYRNFDDRWYRLQWRRSHHLPVTRCGVSRLRMGCGERDTTRSSGTV